MKSEHVQSGSISRRESFRWLGLAGVGAVLGGSRFAAAEVPTTAPAVQNSAGFQGGGFFRKKIGELEVLLLSDGGFPMSPAAFFPTNTADEIAEVARQAFVDPAAVPGHVNTLLVRTADQTILIDTGCGTLFGPTTGLLRANLARAGISPASITSIVITHAHPDHIGGLLAADGMLAFPGVQQIYINEAELKFWTGQDPQMPAALVPDAMKKQMIAGAKGSLLAVKDRLNTGKSIAGALELIDVPGHTPGHSAVQISSGSASMLYIADAMHLQPLQVARPDWKVLYDADPAQGAKSRRALLDRAAADRSLISGAHLNFPAFGHLEKVGDGYAYIPAVWEW